MGRHLAFWASIWFARIGADKGLAGRSGRPPWRVWRVAPSDSQALALGLLHGGRLLGYGVRRACRDGYKIGTLFADTPDAADTLFGSLCARLPANDPVFLDTPASNPAALAERHGLRPTFETARMYAGPAPALATARTYGITSFELG
jgi:hypothetical protein